MTDPGTLPDWALPIREAFADPCAFQPLPEGWRALLAEMDDRIAWVAPAARYEECGARFGLLRVRVTPMNAEALAAILVAEQRASITCEVCGSPGGGVHQYGVCRTLCATCAERGGFDPIRT